MTEGTTRPTKAWADLLAALTAFTPEHSDALRACADAQLRGDAVEAWRRYREVPRVHDSAHDRLAQLASLGPEPPGGVVARWLSMQALRPHWSDQGSVEAAGEAWDLYQDDAVHRARAAAYVRPVSRDLMRGLSPALFELSMVECDWIAQELEGLAGYLGGGGLDVGLGEGADSAASSLDHSRGPGLLGMGKVCGRDAGVTQDLTDPLPGEAGLVGKVDQRFPVEGPLDQGSVSFAEPSARRFGAGRGLAQPAQPGRHRNRDQASTAQNTWTFRPATNSSPQSIASTSPGDQTAGRRSLARARP